MDAGGVVLESSPAAWTALRNREGACSAREQREFAYQARRDAEPQRLTDLDRDFDERCLAESRKIGAEPGRHPGEHSGRRLHLGRAG